MGIAVEFNLDLCLRRYGTEGRRKEECLPEELEVEHSYSFLKRGQRNFWLEGEVPLRVTKGNGVLSRPFASVRITEATQYFNGKHWTRGFYYVKEVFDPDDGVVHFDGLDRIDE